MKRSPKLIALTAFVIGAVWFIYASARMAKTSPSTATKHWTVAESLANPSFALYMVKDCIQHSLRDPDSLVIESAGKFLYLKYEGKYWWVSKVIYRAKNGFGGFNRESVMVLVDKDDVDKYKLVRE